MVRAIALYRASTKQQLSKELNAPLIPKQRELVLDYIKSQGWKLVREFTEGGISGFRTKTEDRDVLQEIKMMAMAEEFDVLVVYMSDRIGRIADETPLVISFLNNYGVKVWSITEGEIKAEDHTDKLLTYIRFWQSEGESRKLSKRITDYHSAMVSEGRFRGGSFIPLGYKLVDNGSKNFKGRNILDFVIDEEEAETVKLIYHLSMDLNYGETRIAKHLNSLGVKTKKGGSWYQSSVHGILTNPIYKGQFRFRSKHNNEEILSPVQEHLIIIPPEQWDLNRKIMQARGFQKKDNIVRQDKRVKRNHGKLLLNGLAYCGHCGERLTTMTAYNTWTLKDGTKKKEAYHKYRCGSFYKKGAIQCDGQSTYSTKIERLVVEETKAFLLGLSKNKLSEEIIRSFTKEINRLEKEKRAAKEKLHKLEREASIIKEEIPKALLGESNFKPELLSQLLEAKEQEISLALAELKAAEHNIKQMAAENVSYYKLHEEVVDWDKRFDELELDGKKAMLASVIDKVTVFKDNVVITYNVKFDTFNKNRNPNIIDCSNEQLVRVPR